MKERISYLKTAKDNFEASRILTENEMFNIAGRLCRMSITDGLKHIIDKGELRGDSKYLSHSVERSMNMITGKFPEMERYREEFKKVYKSAVKGSMHNLEYQEDISETEMKNMLLLASNFLKDIEELKLEPELSAVEF